MTEKTVETLSDELSQVLQEIVTNPDEEPKRAVVVDEKTILVDEVHYQIIEDIETDLILKRSMNDITIFLSVMTIL